MKEKIKQLLLSGNRENVILAFHLGIENDIDMEELNILPFDHYSNYSSDPRFLIGSRKKKIAYHVLYHWIDKYQGQDAIDWIDKASGPSKIDHD